MMSFRNWGAQAPIFFSRGVPRVQPAAQRLRRGRRSACCSRSGSTAGHQPLKLYLQIGPQVHSKLHGAPVVGQIATAGVHVLPPACSSVPSPGLCGLPPPPCHHARPQPAQLAGWGSWRRSLSTSNPCRRVRGWSPGPKHAAAILHRPPARTPQQQTRTNALEHPSAAFTGAHELHELGVAGVAGVADVWALVLSRPLNSWAEPRGVFACGET